MTIPASRDQYPREIPQSNEHGETPFIEGPAHHLESVQKQTADKMDGTLILSFEIAASDIPASLQASPSGSLWRLRLPDTREGDLDLNVVRHDIKDSTNGRVVLRFSTVPGGIPPWVLWGNKGRKIDITISSLAGQHPFPHFIERSERQAVMRRATILCAEPGFQAWIANEAVTRGLPAIEPPSALPSEEAELDARTTKEMTAAEYLCRLTGIDSRRDLLISNRAAERVENVIRQWRNQIRIDQEHADRYGRHQR